MSEDKHDTKHRQVIVQVGDWCPDDADELEGPCMTISDDDETAMLTELTSITAQLDQHEEAIADYDRRMALGVSADERDAMRRKIAWRAANTQQLAQRSVVIYLRLVAQHLNTPKMDESYDRIARRYGLDK